MGNYAGFWIRFGAYIIDTIVLIIIGSILGIILGVGALGMDTAAASGADAFGGASLAYNLVSLVVGIAYFAGFESSSWQATLGKKALGLVVTDMEGQRISVLRAIGRYLGKILSSLILLIGFIMAAFTERKQGLHDIIASTLVLKGEPGMIGADPSVFE